jgi:DNA repair exonuclease SbcCD nuclease subunit
MSINLVWRTDVHLSDRAPSSRTDDWAATVFDKLGQVRDLAREVNAAAIIDGGDFFHIKSPGRNSHALVHRTAEHHADYPCPIYCTPGNHDSVYGDYAFLPQQPLGVLFSTGVYNRLYDEHEAIFTRDGVTVRVVGIPYHGSTYDMQRFNSIEKGDEDVLICVAHVLASNKGGTMFEGEDIVKYEDLMETAPDVYFFGHWHMDQGIEKIENFYVDSGQTVVKHFVNVGSLTRGALSQDELERRPASVVIRCTKKGVEFETHRLDVGLPEEVFDLDGRARQVRRQVEMDSFVTKIRDSLIQEDPDQDLSETLKEASDIPEDVRSRALAYLEQS